MPGERTPLARLKRAAIAVMAVALVVLLYREFGGELSAPFSRRWVFERIYERGYWDRDEQGKRTSGFGSTLEFTRLYRVFLQDFLAAHQIRSVVDAGCGDWEFSKSIDWKGVDYLGVDIVPSVIEANRRRYGATNIRFAVADIVRDELPPADLLLVKDVLQHLSHADITRFLAQLPRYRHVLLVNDVQPDSLSAEPRDIQTGGYRHVDPTQPPHSLPGTKILAWHHGGFTKLVVHLQRRDDPAGGERK